MVYHALGSFAWMNMQQVKGKMDKSGYWSSLSVAVDHGHQEMYGFKETFLAASLEIRSRMDKVNGWNWAQQQFIHHALFHVVCLQLWIILWHHQESVSCNTVPLLALALPHHS